MLHHIRPRLTFLCLAALIVAGFADFTLEDQFRKQWTPAALFAGKPVVIIGGDLRKTADFIKEWRDRLVPLFGERVRIVGLADLDGVPFFVSNSSVRSSLAEDLPKLPVLCDWDGDVYPKLGFAKDAVSVHVYGTDRRLAGKLVGRASEAGAQRVKTLVDGLPKTP